MIPLKLLGQLLSFFRQNRGRSCLIVAVVAILGGCGTKLAAESTPRGVLALEPPVPCFAFEKGIPEEYMEYCMGFSKPSPTPAPDLRFSVTIDGEPAYDQGRNRNPIITDLVPQFEVKIDAPLKISNVDIKFQTRRDKVTPVLIDKWKNVTPDGRTFIYRVPFEKDSILFPGDQEVKVTVVDSLGRTAVQDIRFAIGKRDIIPGERMLLSKQEEAFNQQSATESDGNSEQQLSTQPYIVTDEELGNRAEPPAPQGGEPPLKANLPTKYRSWLHFEYPALEFLGATIAEPVSRIPKGNLYVVWDPSKPMPPAGASVGVAAAAVGTAAGIVFFGDEAAATVFEYFDTKLNDAVFRFEVKDIGVVQLKVKRWEQIRVNHQEITATIAAKAMLAIKQRATMDYEVWRRDDSLTPREDQGEHLVIFKRFGRIYRFVLKNAYPGAVSSINGQSIFDVIHATGVVNRAKKGLSRDITYQWSDVVNSIAEYDRNSSSNWRVQFGNFRPPFGIHALGRIEDSAKPYMFPVGGKAEARKDRTIVETMPFNKATMERYAQGYDKNPEIPPPPITRGGVVIDTHLSRSARASQKHAQSLTIFSNKKGRGAQSVFPKDKGNNFEKNIAGPKIVRSIINHPGAVVIRFEPAIGNPKFRIYEGPQGGNARKGVEYYTNGHMKGFIQSDIEDPPFY